MRFLPHGHRESLGVRAGTGHVAPNPDAVRGPTPLRHARVAVGDVLSVLWLVVVAIWTVRFALMLWESIPVIEMFEREAGRKLTALEWLYHSEARAIFCGHGAPAETRIGRTIDATFGYEPELMLAAVPTYLSGIAVLLRNVSRLSDHDSQRSQWFAIAVGALIATQFILFVVHADTISILTEVTE